MRGYFWTVCAVIFLAATVLISQGQTVRLANGVVVKGDVLQISDAGLEIKAQAGNKVYTWETLSPATRFYYQPLFRANYEAVLLGLPKSAWTNPADEAVAGIPTQAVTEAAKPAEKPVEQAPATLNLFEQAVYENVSPITAVQIPGLRLRTPAAATYIGFQYGPLAREVIYLAFDTKNPQEIHDTMYIYAPALPAYSNTLQVGGMKRSSGDTRSITYKKIKFNTRFGQIDTGYEAECTYVAAQTNLLRITIAAELSKGDLRSRFILGGEPTDLLQGDGLVSVKGILDFPILWLGLDLTAPSPRLVGNLNMAQMKMVPRDGMDNRVNVTIMDDKSTIIQKEQIKLDEASLSQKYGIVCDLKKLSPGQNYTVQSSLNLGPFIGEISFDDKFTLPAAAK